MSPRLASAGCDFKGTGGLHRGELPELKRLFQRRIEKLKSGRVRIALR